MHSAVASDFYISYHRVGLQLSKTFRRIQARSLLFSLTPILVREMRACLRATENLLDQTDLASVDKEESMEILVKLNFLHCQYRDVLAALQRLEKASRLYSRFFFGPLIAEVQSTEERLDDIIESLAISLDDALSSMLQSAVVEATG